MCGGWKNFTFTRRKTACKLNSERMVKIGAELPKLSQKYGYPFFGQLVVFPDSVSQKKTGPL